MIKQAWAALDVGGAAGVRTRFPTIGSFVTTLLKNAYAFLGVVFLFLLVLGGWGIMSLAGEEDQAKIAQSKKRLTMAVVGFLVIFLSYFIIKAIEVITSTNILQPGI